MKFPILVLLVLATACGGGTQENPTAGAPFRFDPQALTEGEKATLTRICNSVDDKSAKIADYSGTFTFNYGADNCDKVQDVQSHDISTTINSYRDAAGNDAYSFIPGTVENYPFKEVETSHSGILTKMCDNVRSSAPMNMIALDTTGKKVLKYQVSSSSDCQSDDNNLCVFLTYGFSTDGTNFSPDTREALKMRVKLGDNYEGFFMSRVKRTSVGCLSGESVLTTILR